MKPPVPMTLDSLVQWLDENAYEVMIAPGVNMTMLIEALDKIAKRQWSDSIDARGEDA